jgi:YHS domain-containing protein
METLIYFLIWGALIFFMMHFGCGAHVMGHGHSHGDARSSSGDNVRWTGPDKDVDPVCGMTVETAKAKSAVHDGHVYYFCSQNCREKFEANPASYLKPATDASHVMEHHHES